MSRPYTLGANPAKAVPATRIAFYDVLRTIACIMVCIVHSPASSNPQLYHNYFALTTYSMMAGVCLFLISGALVMPTDLSLKGFLSRRIDKIAYPMIFWTLIYLIYASAIHSVGPIELLRRFIISPVINGGGEELWFMYELLGLYLIVPIISPWLKQASRRSLEFYLMIWAVYLCLPYLEIASGMEMKSSVFNYVGGFAGYMLLGYYLRKYWEQTPFARYPWLFVGLFLLVWALPALLIRSDTPTSCLTLGLASITMAIYITVRSLDLKSNRFIRSVSRLSFGIYLSHCFISQRLLFTFDWILCQHIIIEMVIVSAVSFFGAWAICQIIDQTPLRRFVLGVK